MFRGVLVEREVPLVSAVVIVCVVYALQAGLPFGQKAQYVHVCRWFDQVLNILCVYMLSADRKSEDGLLYVCVCVCMCAHSGIILYHSQLRQCE